MRLAVDVRILHAPGAGSASYTRGWLGALPEAGFAGQLLLIGPAPTAEQLDGLEAVDVVAEGARLCDEWWEQTALPALLDGLQPGPVHLARHHAAHAALLPAGQRGVRPGLRAPSAVLPARPARLPAPLGAAQLSVADAVVTLSRFGRTELIDCYGLAPERIAICPGGVSERFRPTADRAELRPVLDRYGISEPYLLSVCSLEHNKNLPRLLQAFSIAAEGAEGDWRLVLTGRPGSAAPQLHQLIAQLGLAERVILTGFVPDDDLPALYAGAELFAFVSLYEGFGLPPLEAMACGTAVLASTAASLPEVLGKAAWLVDPTDLEAIAGALGTLMADEGARGKLAEAGLRRAARFTWARTARALLDRCEELTCAS